MAAAVLLLEEMLEGVLQPLAVTGRPLPVAPHRDEACQTGHESDEQQDAGGHGNFEYQ